MLTIGSVCFPQYLGHSRYLVGFSLYLLSLVGNPFIYTDNNIIICLATAWFLLYWYGVFVFLIVTVRLFNFQIFFASVCLSCLRCAEFVVRRCVLLIHVFLSSASPIPPPGTPLRKKNQKPKDYPPNLLNEQFTEERRYIHYLQNRHCLVLVEKRFGFRPICCSSLCKTLPPIITKACWHAQYDIVCIHTENLLCECCKNVRFG